MEFKWDMRAQYNFATALGLEYVTDTYERVRELVELFDGGDKKIKTKDWETISALVFCSRECACRREGKPSDLNLDDAYELTMKNPSVIAPAIRAFTEANKVDSKEEEGK